MISLHSVTKEMGRGSRKTLVLDEIDWDIAPHTHYAILGQRGVGKSTLLGIVRGSQTPTSGWVDRCGSVSWISLLRYGTGTVTPRRMAARFAKLYGADPEQLAEYVDRFADMNQLMDIPVASLTRQVKAKLGLALFYAIPCDLYLFDMTTGTKIVDMKERCRQAYLRRREESSMILVTSSPKAAKEFDGITGVMFAGKLTFFKSADDAIAVFERLPAVRLPVEPLPTVDEFDEDFVESEI